VFKSRSISLPAKRAAYVELVLSILLYGSECWCLTIYHGDAMAEAADVPPFMHQGNVQDQPLAHVEV
jgi:hypothetical protein